MIDVLTPTYNRSYTLRRLYDSLLFQTDKDFRWVIVDDGSVDDTKNLVKEFILEKKIEIVYFFQPNAGKHIAINNGVNRSSSKWVIIVDSDDALEEHAIETIRKDTLDHGEYLAGLCYRRSFFDGLIVGNSGSAAKVRKVMSPSAASILFGGDLAYVFQVRSLKLNPFPLIPGEYFVPELYIWNKLSLEGGIYYYGDVSIYLCEYLEDGYSQNFRKNLRKNPFGFLIFYISQIKFETSLSRKLKCIARALQCAIFAMRGGK